MWLAEMESKLSQPLTFPSTDQQDFNRLLQEHEVQYIFIFIFIVIFIFMRIKLLSHVTIFHGVFSKCFAIFSHSLIVILVIYLYLYND